MTIQELFIQSNTQLKTVIDQITDEQWILEMPEGTTRLPTTLHAAVNYHAYDDAWVPDVLSGRTSDEVGDVYESIKTMDQADTLATYDEYNSRANDAALTFSDLKSVVHLSYGDFTAREYLQHVTVFRAFRSFDIARLIGVDDSWPDELTQALWDEYEPLFDGYRQMGVFPPAVSVPVDADLRTKLLAATGRAV